MTRVSVLLPAFNAEAYVVAAVESILAQTARDFELLIIDDGSTDRTFALISELASRDSRIRCSSRPNRGLVETLNELLERAVTPFIARMDADDVAEPDRFERQLLAFEQDCELLAVGSDVYLIDPAGRRLKTVSMPHTHAEIDRHTMAVIHGCGMCHPAMMFRREAFELVGKYRPEFWPAEDADLVLRIAERGRVENLAVPLLSYRAHEGSIGHRQAARQREALYLASRAAAERRDLPPPDPALRVLPEGERGSLETAAHRDIKWAWWALASGNKRTARALALRAVLNAPLTKASWLVLACAIRGY